MYICYVFNNYTDRTPGCSISMLTDPKCESLEQSTLCNSLVQNQQQLTPIDSCFTSRMTRGQEERRDCNKREQLNQCLFFFFCLFFNHSFHALLGTGISQIPSWLTASTSAGSIPARCEHLRHTDCAVNPDSRHAVSQMSCVNSFKFLNIAATPKAKTTCSKDSIVEPTTFPVNPVPLKGEEDRKKRQEKTDIVIQSFKGLFLTGLLLSRPAAHKRYVSVYEYTLTACCSA